MTQPLIHVDRESLLNLERSLAREWLETDGLGGYASSTLLQCSTRRYHGLLVSLPPGMSKRYNFLSRFDENFLGNGKTFATSMARYPGLWWPLGHQGIERFELVPWPSWVYLFGSARVERDVLMVRGERTVLVRYRVSGQRHPVELQLRPLLPFREADALTFENEDLSKPVERLPNGIRARPYPALPAISITLTGNAHFEADPCWYRQLEYEADSARGYDGHEDNFNPGELHVALESGVDVFVAASIDGAVGDPSALWKRESALRLATAKNYVFGMRAALSIEADDFLYTREDGSPGVIAGFPWFGEWGRDTFLSLPGLTLARGKIELARDALRGARRFLSKGLFPNIFGRGAEDSLYNSVDASLWFARAVRLYEQAAGAGSAAEFLPALREIAGCYARGTELGVHADEGGLLVAGSAQHNITWMDAVTSQGPVTPRAGCAVEIEALWYFLLALLEDLERRAGNEQAAREWGGKQQLAGDTFLARFWLAEEQQLGDVWNAGKIDRSVRPNMVIAAALEWSPLSKAQRAAIVARARLELLTPLGLRTLSPRDPAYKAHYSGTQDERDAAYHQGTVWPWLLGFYVEAALRAEGAEKARVGELRALLDGFEPQLALAGLNHVSEVADGEAPQRPGGTIAQAWNTGELLRAYRLLETGVS